MNSVCPKCAKYLMMCHRTGRSPMVIIGLGAESTCVRIRRPRPPQKRTTFMAFPSSDDDRTRDGQDEPATPLADERELLHDLLAQVPRKDQHQVRSDLAQPLRRVDRDVCAGQEEALLVRAAVDGERQQVGPD